MDPINVRVSTPAGNTNVQRVKSTFLKQGRKVRKEAILFGIKDGKTGELHHETLKLVTEERVGDDWGPIDKRSISLEPDAIDALGTFLGIRESGDLPTEDGGYVVLPSSNDAAKLMERVQELGAGDKAKALGLLLQHATERPEQLRDLISRLAADGGYLEKAAAAMNLVLYERVVDKLDQLIENSSNEGEFQRMLNEHPWLFGSEYSSCFQRRSWTRDENLDFVVRRTVDGRAEIIEIKTPLGGRELFRYDGSHNNLFPGVELAKVIAQVEKYLESLDHERNSILASDGVEISKICAKIIIGRDGNKAQQEALCRHNGHLHRIEIITFDGLLAIARRVLNYLKEPYGEVAVGRPAAERYELDDDIPF